MTSLQHLCPFWLTPLCFSLSLCVCVCVCVCVQDLPVDAAKVKQRLQDAHGFVHDRDVDVVVGAVGYLLAHKTTAVLCNLTSGEALVRVPLQP